MTRSRWFTRLALVTVLLTVGLIVFGAVVRVTDSGLGCGNHWPLCNGTIFPPLDNLTAWIEWLHRLFALLIGAFGLATLAVAIGAFRKRNRAVLGMTITAAALFVLQSALGALVVVLDLPPTFVTLHLGTAMLLLAALLTAALLVLYQPKRRYQTDRFTMLTYTTTALSFVIILTGALVRGSGATLACTTWPLCNNNTLLPLGQGQWAMIHMFHRFAVGAFGVALALLVWQVFRSRHQNTERWLSLGAAAAYLAQAGIGAGYVLSSAAPLWGALHVLFAALTWALLVCLTVVEVVNTRKPEAEEKSAWQPQSSPALN